ncbi:uncharacterized protein DUF4868 [Pseudomonas sp. LP_7_YM]|nr:uncharacterized protein DUF4868 [Pseudomonas sp. LP_7_YM]
MSAELGEEVRVLFESQRDSFFHGIDEVIPFDGRYTPDESELLSIADFPDVDGLAAAVASPLAVDQFDPQNHSLDVVKAFFVGVQNNGTTQILIQIFERRRVISRTLLSMFFSGDQFQKMTDSGLTFDKKLLAVLEGNILKFHSFHFAKRVFELSEYYREATNEEVSSFAQHEKMSVEDVAQFVLDAGAQTRKKISLILQSGVLDNYTIEHISTVAKTMQLDLNLTDGGKITIPSNKTDLKKLLRFLDEDYYESPLSSTRYISNSKRVAD